MDLSEPGGHDRSGWFSLQPFAWSRTQQVLTVSDGWCCDLGIPHLLHRRRRKRFYRLGRLYIKQIGLPLPVYVLRSFISVSLVMLLSILAYFVVAVLYGVSFALGVLWVVPGLLLVGLVVLFLIVTFAYLNARFRDAIHLASAVLQVLFYVTQVIWPPEALRDRGLPWVLDYNPFYHLLEVVRQPLLYSEPATTMNYLMVSAFIVGLAVVSWRCARCYHQQVVYFL